MNLSLAVSTFLRVSATSIGKLPHRPHQILAEKEALRRLAQALLDSGVNRGSWVSKTVSEVGRRRDYRLELEFWDSQLWGTDYNCRRDKSNMMDHACFNQS